jgi:hypothetical protein
VRSPTGDRIGRDKSGHGKNLTEKGTFTLWRPHRDGQVRTQKESDRARCTYQLETTLGGTSQDMERIQLSEGHSLPGDHIGRDKSGHRKNPTERGALTNWRPHQEGQVRTWKKNPTERGALTSWRPHWKGQVRTQKESDRTRHTHLLETASGETSQDMERIRPSDAHSPTGHRIRRDKLGQKASD